MSIARKVNGVWQDTAGMPTIDDELSATSINPVQNKEIYEALGGKQDVLIAGNNITIAADGKTISATGGAGNTDTELSFTSTNPVQNKVIANAIHDIYPKLSDVVWQSKTWSGVSNFYANSIWTDGTNVYYSSGSTQLVLNRETSTWETKTWTGLQNIEPYGIWTDGQDTYYSMYDAQYILNKETSTWIEKTWDPLPVEFMGAYVWTDGTDTYFSNYNSQYVLDKAESTWLVKDWGAFKPRTGQSIWTDGSITYYSQGNDQYYLNSSTSTWETVTWKGLTSFDGRYTWTDGENIYFSQNANQYVLDKDTGTWSTKEWVEPSSLAGDRIWYDGNDVYYSSGSAQYSLFKIRVFGTSASKDFVEYVEESNGNLVTSGGVYDSVSQVQDALDSIIPITRKWNSQTWIGLTSYNGSYIWTDGDNTYYSNGTSQYVLDESTNTWSAKTWSGMTNFTNTYIWKYGDDVYYSEARSHYILNKTTSTWSTKSWNGLGVIYGDDIWIDDDIIYYSNGSTQYYYTSDSYGYSSWSSPRWSGLNNFHGKYIWTDGINKYYSCGSEQYILDNAASPSTRSWSVKTWNGLTEFNGTDVWTDGRDVYYSTGSSQYILNKKTSTWELITWDINVTGSNVWNTSSNTYYSEGTAQYSLFVKEGFGTSVSKDFANSIALGNEDLVTSDVVANHLVSGDKKFYFDYQNGKYGYNTSANRGADTFVPFSSELEYIAMYGAQSSSASNASVTSHTFNKDYQKVVIIIFSSDTDNNGDNWFKVFNAQQSGTAWANFNNVMTGAWKKIGPTTDFTKTTLPDGWAITMNGYANNADKNKTITAGVAGSGNGFFTIFEKDDVKQNEQAWMYYNTYRRACIIMLGLHS